MLSIQHHGFAQLTRKYILDDPRRISKHWGLTAPSIQELATRDSTASACWTLSPLLPKRILITFTADTLHGTTIIGSIYQTESLFFITQVPYLIMNSLFEKKKVRYQILHRLFYVIAYENNFKPVPTLMDHWNAICYWQCQYKYQNILSWLFSRVFVNVHTGKLY